MIRSDRDCVMALETAIKDRWYSHNGRYVFNGSGERKLMVLDCSQGWIITGTTIFNACRYLLGPGFTNCRRGPFRAGDDMGYCGSNFAAECANVEVLAKPLVHEGEVSAFGGGGQPSDQVPPVGSPQYQTPCECRNGGNTLLPERPTVVIRPPAGGVGGDVKTRPPFTRRF